MGYFYKVSRSKAKGHRPLKELKWSIFCKSVRFLYRHMHLKVSGINMRIIFAKFPGHRVKGQSPSAVRST